MGRGLILAIILVVLLGVRWVAGFAIEYEWWHEMGQVETWIQMLSYGSVPVVGAGLLAFVAFWVAHARGMKHAGTSMRQHPGYAKLATAVALALATLVAVATVDSWTVVRWFGGHGLDSGGWRDPVFGHPLSFYFFDVPFLGVVLRYLLAVSVVAALAHWLTARGWSLKDQLPDWNPQEGIRLDMAGLSLHGALDSSFLRGVAAFFLVAWASKFYLDRYDLLLDDHGSLVGVDWVAENLTIPLLWLNIVAALAAAAGMLMRKPKVLIGLVATYALLVAAPMLVTAVYVRPSEITIQKPFIKRHIEATRSAYGLGTHTKETDFAAKIEAPIDVSKHRQLLDNVRLWDWRAFHDTVTQIQALRPYYVFHDSDVDRYQVDGQLRQVLVTPREIDVAQLPGDARSRWINPHFIYTHGYGMVVAEAARITKEGLPLLLVQDAPAVVKTPSLKLTRPELYYGEVSHEPVFVHTKQPEFNYPSGAGNVETRYEGKGGFPMSSIPMRLAAALSTGDWNILLTSYLAPESRMMIRRKVRERLEALAGFVVWDADPYLVITKAGRLTWMVDGYTTSNAHPYSKMFVLEDIGRVNYIRNSVKATVDAYDGTISLYAFGDRDPLLAAYQQLFPKLIQPWSAMPDELKAHARYPELIFRLQAEVYRTYHMTNPEAFFNKEDQWDIARNLNGPSGKPEPVSPTYVVATLPGSDVAEFLLMTTFTPRNKDNLIGVMVARCDGSALGELNFLQLSKQELIFGPMQIEARISQDQNISKDLTLWNQQGSQVLRGQMLVLPVENTLLYIEPIYIQASEARMPQLKKVVVAMGNRLIYTDTYEQALSELTGVPIQPTQSKGQTTEPGETKTAGSGSTDQNEAARLRNEIQSHLKRFKELMAQGQFADAGKEIEALDRLARQR
ncbi:UPF0182 family protein [uncultured Paludibaculum sp.]|uniref:UPF0182 family protein n=1 Tax=uncultured Paludibaculum sp. TaxID=1765020 RepID=UPI002AAACCB8|nr:UPF0182 family protein [uncultured Paludibaculum sp.]